MIRRTAATRNRLVFITEALRQLSSDERFLALIEDEDLATMPENVAERIHQSEMRR
jgi:ParB family chromosome partitioning protein